MSPYPEIADKLMSLEESVSRFVTDGCQLSIGGFTVTRNPMAAVYEIVRQRIRNIHLVAHSNGQGLDVLIGAGCVKRVEIAYGGNGRYAPTCFRFRRAVEQGWIEFEDYSNYQMSLRFLAGALSIPFIATKSGLGSDLLRQQGFSEEIRKQDKVARKKFEVIQNPFAEEEDRVVLLPALTPDVTILHAQYVGEDGTVRIKGLTFADVEQAKSADAVIVTCEEIVPRAFIRLDPDQNTMPGFFLTPRPAWGSTTMTRSTSITTRRWPRTTGLSRSISRNGSTAFLPTRPTWIAWGRRLSSASKRILWWDMLKAWTGSEGGDSSCRPILRMK